MNKNGVFSKLVEQFVYKKVLGVFFNTECSPFYYGDSCNNKCSPNCVHGTCFVNNGSCVDGCKCSKVEELQSQGNIINIPFINDIKIVFKLRSLSSHKRRVVIYSFSLKSKPDSGNS